MNSTPLILRRAAVRAVLVPLRRPVIADIGRFDEWPLVLVDLEMDSGLVGSSYIAPYRSTAVPAIVAELRDLLSGLSGRPVAPSDAFAAAMRSLNVIGLQGVSTISTSAIDMALWDGLAKAAGMPLAQLLGGSVGPVRAYNSNGLWRHEVTTLAAEAHSLVDEGGFTAVKLRLGNEKLRDDLAAIDAVRQGIGEQVDASSKRSP